LRPVNTRLNLIEKRSTLLGHLQQFDPFVFRSSPASDVALQFEAFHDPAQGRSVKLHYFRKPRDVDAWTFPNPCKSAVLEAGQIKLRALFREDSHCDLLHPPE